MQPKTLSRSRKISNSHVNDFCADILMTDLFADVPSISYCAFYILSVFMGYLCATLHGQKAAAAMKRDPSSSLTVPWAMQMVPRWAGGAEVAPGRRPRRRKTFPRVIIMGRWRQGGRKPFQVLRGKGNSCGVRCSKGRGTGCASASCWQSCGHRLNWHWHAKPCPGQEESSQPLCSRTGAEAAQPLPWETAFAKIESWKCHHTAAKYSLTLRRAAALAPKTGVAKGGMPSSPPG